VDPNLPGAADRLGRRIYSSVTIAAFTITGGLLLDRHQGVGISLLSLAGATLLFHLIGDLKRRYHKKQ
jgi:hypothetical protein